MSRSSGRPLLQRAVDALIQWSPLGGSLAILVGSALQQNWVVTALSFPVMVITAVWAKYTEHFTERMGEIAGQRGVQDANAVAAWLSNLDQALRLQLSGFDGRYLKAQANACYFQIADREVQIPSGLINPALDEVFVPLRLSDEFFRSGDGDMLPTLPGLQACDVAALKAAAENREPLDIWKLLARTPGSSLRSLAILAWGGSGKTTLLRHLTYRYCAQPRATRRRYKVPEFVPVLLYLRTWRDEIAQSTPPSLPELITQHHIPNLPEGKGLKVPLGWAETLLHSGRALVMIDGFDEVAQAQRPAVSQWIAQQMRDYGKAVFILTSRPSAYNRDYQAEKPTLALKVEPFDEDERRRFVEQWYLCQEQKEVSSRDRTAATVQETATRRATDLLAQIERRQELEDMAQNPLMLNMIAMFHRSVPGVDLPTRRHELYQDICSLQLGDRPLAKRVDMLLSAEQSQQILQAIALDMTLQGEGTSLQEAELLEHMQIQLEQLHETVNPKELLKQIETVSELLVKKDDGYEFAHRSFQEYLTAKELLRLQREDLVLEHFTDEFWQSTVLLYVAMLRKPDTFITAACQQGADAIAFAYDCCKLNSRITPALAATVNQRRYERLETYLSQGEWVKADKETFELMYQTLDRRWTVEGLRNFPCEDLRRLDGLWVQYSQGKWGFSVQKRIWQECGSPMKYGKDWERFGDRVGWRKPNEQGAPKWIGYDQLTKNPRDSPGGEFPLLVAALGQEGFSSLAQRLVDCSR